MFILPNPYPLHTPTTIDKAVPTPGSLSQLYDLWVGKHVIIRRNGLQGTVCGVDTRPYPAGHTYPDGALTIRLDKPNDLGFVYDHAPPEGVEEL